MQLLFFDFREFYAHRRLKEVLTSLGVVRWKSLDIGGPRSKLFKVDRIIELPQVDSSGIQSLKVV